MGSLHPLRYFDGYLPIEDHGLIGDGATAALVGRDGTIWWMCVPRFDSPPLFDSIIDARRGLECAPRTGEVPSQVEYGPIGGFHV
jgi:alpha,alpha-trehalase